ncbi:MAG: VTT domain-containing protein [Caldilineaceae bacterium]|nr:VTT domain-containing protein [Caldilineaceae bacterium]
MDELPAAENTASLQSGPFNINLRVVLSVLALIAITLGSFWAALNPGWVRQAGHWGYLGATLISFLSSATVILPAPGLAVVFSMGGVLNPVLLGILAGIGSGLGELSGYVAGASGRALISPDRTHPFVRHFTTRYTAIALFVFAILPLPIFDFAGIVAGAMRVRLPVFLGTVISGKIIKHVIIALMGAGFLPLLRVFVGM